MEIKYLICSEFVSIDATSNRVSLFNILEDHTPMGYPFMLQNLSIIALGLREAGDDEMVDRTLRIGVSGGPSFDSPVQFDFTGGTVAARCVAQIGGLALAQPGVLTVSLMRGDQVEAQWVSNFLPLPENLRPPLQVHQR